MPKVGWNEVQSALDEESQISGSDLWGTDDEDEDYDPECFTDLEAIDDDPVVTVDELVEACEKHVCLHITRERAAALIESFPHRTAKSIASELFCELEERAFQERFEEDEWRGLMAEDPTTYDALGG